MSLAICRIARPQAGDVTPYNAYVALPGVVQHGPDEALPRRRDLVGHALSHCPDHPVVTFHVRNATVMHAQHGPVGARLLEALADAWRTSRLDAPRRLAALLMAEVPALSECARLLVVIRVPVRGGRSIGLGFAADTRTGGDVLWDLSGLDADRKEAFLVRLYGGQNAREQDTLQRQALLRIRESELPVPTTRFQAVRLALEWALGRDVQWWLPGDVLDHLQGDLRAIVEANLDALWDNDADASLDAVPADLHRWLPGYQ